MLLPEMFIVFIISFLCGLIGEGAPVWYFNCPLSAIALII